LPALANATINISPFDHGLAHQLGYRGRHILIENAVPPAAERVNADAIAENPDIVNILFVGRLDRQKGIDLLLEAFKIACNARNDLRLYVIGAAVRADHQPIDIPAFVAMVGWVDKDNLDRWFRSADAIMVPSRWEGFGLVVPEAFRNGTPAFVSNRGALPSLVKPDETGGIFNLDVESIAARLKTLEKSKLRAMRPCCLERYKVRFAASRWTDSLNDLYASVAPQKDVSK